MSVNIKFTFDGAFTDEEKIDISGSFQRIADDLTHRDLSPEGIAMVLNVAKSEVGANNTEISTTEGE